MNRDLLDALSDICHARASFFRRAAGNWNIYPQVNVTQFLSNETALLNMLTRIQTPPAPPAPAVPAPQPDLSLNLVRMLFGPDAFVGLGQPPVGQGQNQPFWDPVQVGLTPEQFAAGTRDYENPPDVAEQDRCCICLEGITAEAAIHTLCPGAPLGDGVTITNHHSLHRRCARAWFSMSPRCPLCRADLRLPTSTTINAGAGAAGGEPDNDSESDTGPDSQ